MWKNLFKSEEELKKEIRKEILDEFIAIKKKEDEERIALQKKKEEKEEIHKKKVAEEKEALLKKEEEKKAKLKASDEPWVDIKGMVHDPQKGIRIELDWNDAFVKHLRENGFTGADDNAVVQKYIAILAKQVATDMFDDQHNPSNYE